MPLWCPNFGVAQLLLNFIASLWQQGKIQKVEKEHIIIYNIKTVHIENENKH